MIEEILKAQYPKRTAVIECNFCKGSGKDPFELLSPLALCQVCGGSGEVSIPEPAIECAFCGATGVYRDQRLTCTVCGGKGMVTVEEPYERCHICNGKGVAPHNYLPCMTCGGRGVVKARRV